MTFRTKVFCLLLFSALISLQLVAQNDKEHIHPCGTPNFVTDFMLEYKSNPQAFRKSVDTILYVPITVHIVGRDDGSGYYGLPGLYASLCQVNLDYEEAKIYYFIEGDINYIDNESYYAHSDVLEGADMMFANNVDNTINCYIVDDPAGNCGYNLPYAGIAMNTSCMGEGDHTWSHELGHALTVQHPFLGWEGNTLVSGSNAPETLVYNYTYFKDTLIRDTVILDTTFSELVDRSNCSIAADKTCDTPADFIASRWNCNQNGESPFTMKDFNGVEFRSDGSYIMSYADDACQSRFSLLEIEQMRANLLSAKANMLYDQEEPPVIDFNDPGLYPNDIEVQRDNVVLSWNAASGADRYFINLGAGPNMANGIAAVTTDTFFVVENYNFFRGLAYHYDVKPVNSKNFCSDKKSGLFYPVETVSTEELEGIVLGSNVLEVNENYLMSNTSAQAMRYTVYDQVGHSMIEGSIPALNTRSISMDKRGLYFVRFSQGDKTKVAKLIVN